MAIHTMEALHATVVKFGRLLDRLDRMILVIWTWGDPLVLLLSGRVHAIFSDRK
jgi:hypothetical protein